jgi:general L-amino acid transport system permease protein
VVRGGLQALPKGQFEAAEALGCRYWRAMRLIIMPQALRVVFPGIHQHVPWPLQGHHAGGGHQPQGHPRRGQKRLADSQWLGFTKVVLSVRRLRLLGLLLRHLALLHAAEKRL